MKFWLSFLVATAAAAAQAIAPSCSLFPGWKQDGPARSYEGESLFEYMDGNSEGYYAYGFVRMNGVTCVRGEDKIIVDVSEMADPEYAYGIFTANRDPKLPIDAIGSGGQVVPRKLIFAKGKYYGEIAAEPDKDHTATLRQLGSTLCATIPGGLYKPAAFAWFPPEGMTPDSARLVPQSVLGIGLLKRGYIALYGPAKAFVITESSSEAAKTVFAKLQARFAGAQAVQSGDEAFQAADQYLGRLCVIRKGARLAGFANVPDGQDPVAQANGLAARLP